MKNLQVILTPILMLGLTPGIASQTPDPPAGNHLPDTVVAARCQYTPADEACAGLTAASRAKGSTEETTVAQSPRQIPGPPVRRPIAGRPRPTYAATWRPELSGRHALIGALIGGGLGTAIGVRGNGGARASVALGILGAGIGAAMGISIPSFPARSPSRRSPRPNTWPDDDEQASARGQGSERRGPTRRHRSSGPIFGPPTTDH